MTRFFVTPEEMAGPTPCLTGDNAAHARVLRLKPGEQVLLCDGQGQECLCQVENLTCKDVFDAAKAGDPAAVAILEQVYDYMGMLLGNVCSTVNPEVVVIGGGVSKAGEVLLEGVAPYFQKYVFHAASGARFALASLGNDAGAYGAFKLALDAFG